MLLADYVIQGKVQELVVKFLEVIDTSGVTEDAVLSIEVINSSGVTEDAAFSLRWWWFSFVALVFVFFLCVAGWKKEKEGDKGRRQGLSMQAGSYYEQWHQKNQLAIFLEQLFTRFSR